jgi:hypothetical protein
MAGDSLAVARTPTSCSTLFEPRDRSSFWSCAKTGGGPKIGPMDVHAGEWTTSSAKSPDHSRRVQRPDRLTLFTSSLQRHLPSSLHSESKQLQPKRIRFRSCIYAFLTRSLKLVLDSSITRLDVVRTHPLHCIPPRPIRGSFPACGTMCAHIPRRGPTAPQTDSDTPEIGDQVTARGACRRRSDLRGVFLLSCGGSRAASRTACDAHRMQRVRAPTLALDSPPSLSLSHWNPRLCASLLSQHRIFTKRESLLPHAARRLIYGVCLLSRPNSVLPLHCPIHFSPFMLSPPHLRFPIPPPSILPSSLSRDSNAVTHIGAAETRTCLCTRGSTALWMVIHRIARGFS